MPLKAHNTDAGFDLFAPKDFEIKGGDVVKIDTGVHCLIPSDFVGLVFGRSSYGAKGIITHTGVIDAGYTGAISVVLTASQDIKIYAGYKIAQLVILPLPQIELTHGSVTDVQTARGSNGFGSTGKF